MNARTTGPLIWTAISLLFLAASAQAADKLTFWDTQRKGANCFNVEPSEQWFVAARALGVDWVRLTYGKWTGSTGRRGDFLMGSADDFQGLDQQDLARLIEVLDWAHKHDIKVVIAPLDLPGNQWIQNNDNRRDLRLWNDKAYWQQAAAFWGELAAGLKDHPAVCAYNILNEPTPEMNTGLDENGPLARYRPWYDKHRGTAHDLPAFYQTVSAAIRQVDTQTPIMLDAGWYAHPHAIVYWPAFPDDKLLYAFHMYEPYAFTNHRNVRREKPYVYPGKIPYAGRETEWNKRRIERHLAPFFQWAKAQQIPFTRLVCGEFGCYRRNPGAAAYLSDVLAVLNERDLHWAFYSFREDEWDGYDYELGTAALGAAYWQSKEAGRNPHLDRHDNPLFDVIKSQFTPARAVAPTVDPEVRQWIDALASDEWRQRQEAADALALIGPKAGAAVPHLIQRLDDEQWHVRKAAAIALSSMGLLAKPAVPALIIALDDEEWHVRKPAAEALAAIGRPAEPAIPHLIQALNDEEWHVRRPAALALGAIGPAAKSALPALRECLNDPEDQVQRAAETAIRRITAHPDF